MASGCINPPRAAQSTVGVVFVIVIATLATPSSWTAETLATETGSRIGDGPDTNGVNPYSKLSSQQLGSLADTFEELDRDQRRWFLTEVRKRMSAKGDAPKIQVDKHDSFGRVVRRVGRASRDTPSQIGSTPPRDSRAEPEKVYGTGVRSRHESSPHEAPPHEAPPHGSTSTRRSEKPSKPNG